MCFALLAVLLATRCGGSDDRDEADTGTDTPADVSPDPIADVPEDTVADIPGDPGTDTEEDTADPDCIPEATAGGSAGHMPGQDCQGCHGSMTGPLGFTLSGTVYGDLEGSSPVGGATVVVTDDEGSVHQLVTHDNGNFYTTATIAYPATVAVSRCPDTAEMLTTFEHGACNLCHHSAFRVHLP